MINVEIPLVEAQSNYSGEVAKRLAYADGSGETGVIFNVIAVGSSIPKPPQDAKFSWNYKHL
ncbi:MAG: hypothetical protein ACJA0T_000260 [Colwellia sp.]|jgi:hypothetical protein